MQLSFDEHQWLHMLQSELKKNLIEQDPQLINDLIESLVASKLYYYTTEMLKRDMSMVQMVRSHGPYWYEWDNKITQCQSCSVDIRDHERRPPFTTGKYLLNMGNLAGIVLCDTCHTVWLKW